MIGCVELMAGSDVAKIEEMDFILVVLSTSTVGGCVGILE